MDTRRIRSSRCCIAFLGVHAKLPCSLLVVESGSRFLRLGRDRFKAGVPPLSTPPHLEGPSGLDGLRGQRGERRGEEAMAVWSTQGGSEVGGQAKLWRPRSPLYWSRYLRLNVHFWEFFKICKIEMHRSKLKKNQQTFVNSFDTVCWKKQYFF